MIINTTRQTTDDYSWIQPGYTYGVNDSGPWQKFKRRGIDSSVAGIWFGILFNAGWNVTVTREFANGTNDTSGISNIEATAGWAYPYLYSPETLEHIWEIGQEDHPKNLLEADFPNGAAAIQLTSAETRKALGKIVQDDTAIWYPPSSTTNSLPYWAIKTSSTYYLFDDNVMFSGGAVNFSTFSTGANAGQLTALPFYSDALPSVVRLASADAAGAYSLYLLMKAGNETFPVEASVIQHSFLASNQYATQASYNNVDRIISPASMTTLEGVPGGILFAVWDSPTPSQFIETPGDLQYGWRKLRPKVTRLSRQKFRVGQGYQYGLWPVKTFGPTL